jgi:hypothetical protein
VTSPPDQLRALVASCATGPSRQAAPARGGHLSARARKTALTAHVACGATWLGAVAANLFLGISAAVTDDETLADAYYTSMARLVDFLPAAAIATLATGLLLALATRWGLFRHWWIIVKLVLAVTTAVIGWGIIDPAISNTIRSRAETGSTGFSDALLPAIAATPLLLLSATTIAITKPWGRTARARRQARQAAPSP